MSEKFNSKYSEMWNFIYNDQKGKCIVCKRDGAERIDVDWDADLVFGMTCFDCFCILGSCDEDPMRLKSVIKYLKFKDKLYAENALLNEEKPA